MSEGCLMTAFDGFIVLLFGADVPTPATGSPLWLPSVAEHPDRAHHLSPRGNAGRPVDQPAVYEQGR